MNEPGWLSAAARSLELPEERPHHTLTAFCRKVLGSRGIAHTVGAEGCAPTLLAASLSHQSGAPVFYIAPDDESALKAFDDLGALAGPLRAPLRTITGLAEPSGEEPKPLYLAVTEQVPYAEVHPDRRVLTERAATLAHLGTGRPWRYLVTTARALMRRVPPPAALAGAAVELKEGAPLDLEELARKLVAAGYLRVPIVEDPATFAVRGGIFDVWPPLVDLPVRAELLGNEILELRNFHPDDQLAQGKLESVWLPPAREAVLSSQTVQRAHFEMRSLCDSVNFPSARTRSLAEDLVSGRIFFGMDAYLPAFYALVPLWGYLPEAIPWVFVEPADCVAALKRELAAARTAAQSSTMPHFPPDALYASEPELADALDQRRVAAVSRSGVAGRDDSTPLSALENPPIEAGTLFIQDHADLLRAMKAAQHARGRRGALGPLLERIENWRQSGLRILLSARTRQQAERLSSLLSHRDVAVSEGPPEPKAETLELEISTLSRGALCPMEGLVLLTEEEIFGERRHRAEPRRSPRAVLEDLRSLSPGDYLVHLEHGVGRYIGLVRKPVEGVNLDFIEIEYVGGDKLFLPVYRLGRVHKYSGGEGTPKLDRLGGQSFAKAKSRALRRVQELADELLRLCAERAQFKKKPLPEQDDEYRTFEAGFPFEETRDQAAAIADVLTDLERETLMDRLVCGDVGFGKTEVALRAAFRVVTAGRQVALLCPTTLLAQQHYLTFSRRLADHAIEVRPLSRFQSKAEQQDTVQGLRSGVVDVVVGTHRLLSKDVHFKELGLLVVDEEQHFGVAHKERIKQLCTSVDVLTLSATPIPRTLQMAIGGLRSLSMIATPPVDRRSIRTMVARFDDELVRQAIQRELDRGGQVFYVYPRIEGLEERTELLRTLLPQARIQFAHGQLRGSTLERTMLKFVSGEVDVFVTTAIVESGLDIPRANTILIDRADAFGTAQLHQLRGRVGRSNERAYCYLLVPPPNRMTEEARTRIQTLERYTQ
ncbi:MAG TPA: DEAD/DEAH box helicase, partial [Polyangiaceae bacterium]